MFLLVILVRNVILFIFYENIPFLENRYIINPVSKIIAIQFEKVGFCQHVN